MGPHGVWSLAISCIVAAHLLIGHGPAGQSPLFETLHQGVAARWDDAVMLALVGWPNSVAMETNV